MFLSPYFSFKGIDCRNYFIMITTTDKDDIVEVGVPYKTNLTMENSFHYTEEDETPDPIELNLTLVDENRVPLKWTNEYFQNIKDWLISDDFEEFVSYDNPEYVYYFKCIMHPYDDMVLCQYRDITQRSNVKRQLEQANRTLREIQKVAQIGQWVYNTNENVFPAE